MITLLIGHRGAGKTSLLKRLEVLFSQAEDAVFKDLDDEIEALHRRSINSIFANHGEAEFRKLETATFQKLMSEFASVGQIFIAVGAGFEFPVPEGVHTLWIRRPTDKDGRIFFQRPKLSAADAIADWKTRFEAREPRYRRLAREELTLPEGGLHDDLLERHFFTPEPQSLPYALTVLPENFRSPQFFERRKKWGLKWLEIRDDLLLPEEIRKLRDIWPAEKLLFSVRKTAISERPQGATALDWARELGEPPFRPDILSLHDREDSWPDTIAMASGGAAEIFKLAAEVRDFKELLAGHKWWRENPRGRAFLPRSSDGRWQWYRQLFGPQMPIHFFREGDGSSPDQPYLWQTLSYQEPKKGFAAVIGSPVHQSWTPAFQREFFDPHKIPVVAIPVNEAEWEEAFPLLTELGLKFAAVTSPLKQKAFGVAVELSETARRFGSVNTLARAEKGWSGENTDFAGAQVLLSELSPGDAPVLVWGGGGTKAILQACLPSAEFVSARVGRDLTKPVHIVWAVGRGREFVLPKSPHHIQSVIDLNYSFDSPGREIAQATGCPYKSGEAMFIHQGLRQRDFWKRFL